MARQLYGLSKSKKSYYMSKADRVREAERLASHPHPTASTTGVHHPLEPYSGPKSFGLSSPSAAPGSAPEFLVVRDEHLFLPYGGFHVFKGEREVGRNLSYPDYDCCKRLQRESRHEAEVGEEVVRG